MEPAQLLPYLPVVFFVPVVLGVVLFVVLSIFKAPTLPPFADYEKQASLLTPAELVFFNVLLLSVSPDCYVLAKVRIGDLVRVHGLSRESPEWWRKFGPIAKKHCDFVIVQRTSFAPYVVVELDDRTHHQEDRRARDSLVDRVMHAAQLPILHISYSPKGYSRAQIEALIAEALEKKADVPVSPGAPRPSSLSSSQRPSVL